MNSDNVDGATGAPIVKHHIETCPLCKIHIVNILLTIVTIGLYRFWAKTRIRQYLWNHLEVEGDRLEYTGTGKELMLGFSHCGWLYIGAPVLPSASLSDILFARLAKRSRCYWHRTGADLLFPTPGCGVSCPPLPPDSYAMAGYPRRSDRIRGNIRRKSVGLPNIQCPDINPGNPLFGDQISGLSPQQHLVGRPKT